MKDDKIILFPLDRIKNREKVDKPNTKENEKQIAKVKMEQTKRFVETHVDDMAMMMLRKFVEMAIKTDKPNFTKDLALLIDVLRGMVYRDFDMYHPVQALADKIISIKQGRNGPQADINYTTVLPENKIPKAKPLSKDIREEIKFHNEGWEDFIDDFNPDDEKN